MSTSAGRWSWWILSLWLMGVMAAPGQASPLRERLHAFYAAAWVEAYRQHGSRNSMWDAPAEELLSLFARHQVHADSWSHPDTMQAKRERQDQLSRLAAQVLATPCNDPLIRAMASLARFDQSVSARVNPAQDLLQAVDDRYPPLTWFGLDYVILDTAEKVDQDDWRKWTRQNALVFLRGIAGAAMLPQFPHEHHHAMAWLVLRTHEDVDTARIEKLMDDLAAVQGRGRWLACFILGTLLREAASEGRWPGWDQESPEQRAQSRKDLLLDAYDQLQAAHALEPGRAEAAMRLMQVCSRLDRPEETWQWFETAVAADPTHDLTYRHGLSIASQQEHDAHPKMFEIARRAAEGGRFDTNIPDFLDGCLDNLLDSEEGMAWLRAHAADVWPVYEAFAQRRIEQPTRPYDTPVKRDTRSLHIATVLERWDVVEALAPRLADEPELARALRQQDKDARWAVGESLVAGNAAALASLTLAQAQVDRGEVPQAVAMLRHKSAGFEDHRIRDHLRDQAARHEAAAAWQVPGRFADLSARGPEGWLFWMGDWAAQNDRLRADRFHTTQDVHSARVLFGVSPGRRYELTCRIDWPQGEAVQPLDDVSLLIYSSMQQPYNLNRRVGLTAAGEVYLFDPLAKPNWSTSPHKEASPTRLLRVLVWNGRVRVEANGHVHFKDHQFIRTAHEEAAEGPPQEMVWKDEAGAIVRAVIAQEADTLPRALVGFSLYSKSPQPVSPVMRDVRVRVLDRSPFNR